MRYFEKYPADEGAAYDGRENVFRIGEVSPRERRPYADDLDAPPQRTAYPPKIRAALYRARELQRRLRCAVGAIESSNGDEAIVTDRIEQVYFKWFGKTAPNAARERLVGLLRDVAATEMQDRARCVHWLLDQEYPELAAKLDLNLVEEVVEDLRAGRPAPWRKIKRLMHADMVDKDSLESMYSRKLNKRRETRPAKRPSKLVKSRS